jgi:tetratricopeptide (TPR) repeat protein
MNSSGMFYYLLFKKFAMALQVVKEEKELLAKAKAAEEKEDWNEAIKNYQQVVKQDPHYELPYDRLMVIFRKQKRYEDELKLINKGLKFFGDLYKKKSEKLISKHKSVDKLSQALIKKAGLAKTEFVPQPIAKWMKRKEMVEKKLGA